MVICSPECGNSILKKLLIDNRCVTWTEESVLDYNLLGYQSCQGNVS
jgi:hypothetical protein